MSLKIFEKLHSSSKQSEKEAGQSMVLIALVLVGLLAFVGIAVDVGFYFARGSQLQAAVDSAALAGVSELRAGKEPADIKAGQFLNANGVPITTTNGLTATVTTSDRFTQLGSTEYTVTVTWPVELFFLKLIGLEQAEVTRSATAAIFYLADVYASRRVEDGTVSTSTQGIFGPRICHDYGDPFTPLRSPFRPPEIGQDLYTYRYRILIPDNYPDDVLRVELFDPDSINSANNGPFSVVRSQGAINSGLSPLVTKSCGGSQMDPCTLQTDELNLVNNGTLELDQVNPFWFVRIDENRGAGAAPGNFNCGNPGSYNPAFNTPTQYQLSYFRQNNDGTVEEVILSTYTGQIGDGVRDNGNHQTDMRWVSPGADIQGPDFPIIDTPGASEVPVDPGSQTSFEIDLDNDIPGIVTDIGSGARYVYLSVTALDGATENGFEIWAGPDDYALTSPTDVNARNVAVTNSRSSHSSRGATVYALGRLPMNSIYTNPVDIPLVYVGPELAGESILVSMYDSDAGAQPPIRFYFDTISIDDWSLTFGQNGVPDPDGGTGRCRPGSCGTRWVEPAYEITIPGVLDNCDYENPTADECTPFYGGRLMARYIGGSHDTFGWEIRLNGLPYLVE